MRISPLLSRIPDVLKDESRAALRAYPLRRPVILVLAALIAGIAASKHGGRLSAATEWTAWEGERGALIGIVRAEPDRRPTGVVYEIDVETFQPEGDDARSAQGRVLAHILRSTSAVASPGDRLRVFGRVALAPPARTPGAFDYRAFLEARGIGAIVYAGTRGVETLGPSGRLALRRVGARIENRIVSCFERRLSPPSAAVLAGLTVGRRPRFHPEVREAFLESGTLHVLVASGSNVAFIAALLCLAASAVRVPREGALLLSLPFVWLYVLAVGGDVPITRAGLMATITVLALVLGREDRPYHALAVAALALLALDPPSLFDVGLQMSFLTVFGFMYHLPAVESRLAVMPVWLGIPARALMISLVAQVWLIPISANVFHRLYPVALIANLIIVPAASAGLAIGLVLAALDALPWAAPAAATAVAADAYGAGLLAVARFFAAHPGVSFWLPSLHPWQIAGFFVAALALPFFRARWFARIAFVAGVAAVAWLRATPVARPATWGVAWLDVGARTAAVVVDSERSAILINPGPSEPANSAERILGPFFCEAGIDRLAAIIVTDPRVTTADVAAVRGVIEVDRVEHASATAPLFGAWGEGRAPRPMEIAGFQFRVLPGPPWAGDRPLWVAREGSAALLAHRIELETQGAALERREALAAVQGRFDPEMVWSPAFRRRFKPVMLVESAGPARESRAPWRGEVRRPQEEGWVWWEASGGGPIR